jgi:8-oxo-dGTP pyrophosphatase MutT (NUDIX family)/diadenosine tetraphosphate (Ap4A) HIT family hydrolase
VPPLSCKAVITAAERVLLLRNPRGEWELPGGRPEPGESGPAAVVREVREETALEVEPDALVAEWRFAPVPGREVAVAAWGCRVARPLPVRLAEEHEQAGWFAPGELAGLELAEGYRRAAEAWLEEDWREDRVGAAHRGRNPMVLRRMGSGFAVVGDTQHLPGYVLLLCDDPTVDHLTDLPRGRRTAFLADMALLGEAVQTACAADGLRRINYEVLGNELPLLHAHVHARYHAEPPEHRARPVSSYPSALRFAPEHAYDPVRHRALRTRSAAALRNLQVAYDRRHEH